MNIIRKGAVALAALAALGTSAGFVVAAETASAAPTVVTYTSQERTAVLEAPGLVAYGFNLYQPSVIAPGYRLAATATELCLTGPRGKLCTWRITGSGCRPSRADGQRRGGAVRPGRQHHRRDAWLAGREGRVPGART